MFGRKALSISFCHPKQRDTRKTYPIKEKFHFTNDCIIMCLKEEMPSYFKMLNTHSIQKRVGKPVVNK